MPLLYHSCILYYNHAHCQHQTKSLTHFLSLSNIIATTPIINNNIAPLLLLSQNAMFSRAMTFNQDISGWDVGSGTNFVSGLGLWESCFLFISPLELGALSLLLLSLKGCFIVHVFFIIIMLIIIIKLKVSYHSFLCPILLLLLLSTPILHHFSCLTGLYV